MNKIFNARTKHWLKEFPFFVIFLIEANGVNIVQVQKKNEMAKGMELSVEKGDCNNFRIADDGT